MAKGWHIATITCPECSQVIEKGDRNERSARDRARNDYRGHLVGCHHVGFEDARLDAATINIEMDWAEEPVEAST